MTLFIIAAAHVRRRGSTLARLWLSAALAAVSIPSAGLAETLGLDDALTRVIQNSPGGRASAARIEAAQAAARQAGVRPNPTVGLDVENLGSRDSNVGAARTETTLYYQQTLERGGKRQARTEAASRDVAVTQTQAVVTALDLFETVESLWVEAIFAEAQIGLAENRLAIAVKNRDEVMRRVNAARDPLFAGTQADSEVAQARLDLDQAKMRSQQARQALAAYWGGAADFETEIPVVPDVSALAASPSLSSPDLALLEAERDRASALIRVEQTRRTQDVSVRGGVRYFSGDGSAALVVGGSIPLGRNDSNRGNIERVQAQRTAAEADVEAKRLEILRERSRLLSRVAMNVQEIRQIDTDVLPPARKTLDLVQDGYARGGFRHTDVIAAAEAIATIEARRLAILKAAHLDIVKLNRLDGRHAGLVALTDTQP
jgi:outer membrane protein, heavy metal efflux system